MLSFMDSHGLQAWSPLAASKPQAGSKGSLQPSTEFAPTDVVVREKHRDTGSSPHPLVTSTSRAASHWGDTNQLSCALDTTLHPPQTLLILLGWHHLGGGRESSPNVLS